MIRAGADVASKPSINPMRGEFQTTIAGRPCRFDTKLSTIASIEAACGDRPIVEVLNAIIVGRRARDLIPLLGAALAAVDPEAPDAAALAEQASVGDAEAFVLSLIVALGFKVGRDSDTREAPPLPPVTTGGGGASSRSAA